MPLTEVREQLVLPDASSGRRSINWLYDRSKASALVQDSIGEANHTLLRGVLSRIILKDGVGTDVQRLAADILGDLGCDTASDMYREVLASVKQKGDPATTALVDTIRVRLGERLPSYNHLLASISDTSLPLWVRLRAIEALAFANHVPDAEKVETFLRDLWTSEAGVTAQAEVDIHRCIYGLAQSDSGFESLAKMLKSQPTDCDLAMVLNGLHNAATSDTKRRQVDALAESLASDVARLPVSLVERMAWTTIIPNSGDAVVRTFVDQCLGNSSGKERTLIGFTVLAHRYVASEYLNELSAKLQSKDPAIRAGAAELLRQCAKAESPVTRKRGLTLIDQALDDHDSTVRVAAVYSLGGYFVANNALDHDKYLRKFSAMMKQAQDAQEIKTLARGIAAMSEGKFSVAEPRDNAGHTLLGKAQQQWWKANAPVVKQQALAWAAQAGYSNGAE